jgi:hypothetical protein
VGENDSAFGGEAGPTPSARSQRYAERIALAASAARRSPNGNRERTDAIIARPGGAPEGVATGSCNGGAGGASAASWPATAAPPLSSARSAHSALSKVCPDASTWNERSSKVFPQVGQVTTGDV